MIDSIVLPGQNGILVTGAGVAGGGVAGEGVAEDVGDADGAKVADAGTIVNRFDILDMCLEFPNSYVDAPFSDTSWELARHRENNKVFAWVFDRFGNIWVNLKCDDEGREAYRSRFPDHIIPAYHLNHYHWNSLILDGTIPDADIKYLVSRSFMLTLSNKLRVSYETMSIF